eukprot:2837410-Rhodomonas_salina.2
MGIGACTWNRPAWFWSDPFTSRNCAVTFTMSPTCTVASVPKVMEISLPEVQAHDGRLPKDSRLRLSTTLLQSTRRNASPSWSSSSMIARPSLEKVAT